ncbi:TPA: ATP-binding cassette domain-containing protein [Streptococcus suis]|nr:ATP-binding cassette domain-containing protein [Streptococcus suis]HEM5151265.1 ATP-binding cassette domain-containing protein [Streptococcus suis]HEM5168514.1 ATP-binding cassette domain-containing protein [Streptococcus suis]
MSNKEIALKVESVSKTFKLPTESTQSLRTTLVNYFRGIKGYKEQQVLKDISFEVEKGDFFGIVGRNGSGKSTLLKIISQIYVPEKGKVSVNGTLVPFIELGVGFNPELTGRENIYLNGALLGFTRSEIDSMYDDIVEFAELEEFMDQKLKNYSSGMQVRLAFSIAIKAEGDILVLDEVLAVGDEAFQRKCFEYFASLKKQKKTVILVTHDMASVQRFCTKAMMIDSGEISIIGDPNMVAGKYTLRNVEHRNDSKKVEGETVEKGEQRKNSIDVLSIRTKNSSKATDTFYLTDDILVEVKYKVNKPSTFTIGTSFRDYGDNLVAGIGSIVDMALLSKEEGEYLAECRIPASQFIKGEYSVNVSFWSDTRELLGYEDITMEGNPPKINIVEANVARSGQFNAQGTWSEI